MKCSNCGQKNKPNEKVCKKCSKDIAAPQLWFPTWKWHVKTLSLIYIVLIVCFFAAKYFLRKLPPPYNTRTIPSEMTPWLNSK